MNRFQIYRFQISLLVALGIVCLITAVWQSNAGAQVASAPAPTDSAPSNASPKAQLTAQLTAQTPVAVLERQAGALSTIDVMFRGQRFTRFLPTGNDKPVFYPVVTPAGVAVTRSWPLESNSNGRPKKSGIADDHPHHKSLWHAHEANGIDFWTEKDGKILVDDIAVDGQRLICKSSWTTNENQVICVDETQYTFGQSLVEQTQADERITFRANWLDTKIRLTAAENALTLNDTKEGFFAIRTHPDLRISPDPKRGVDKVFGRAINSEGQTDKALWGQMARWVMYYGPVDGRPVSILMCDHPDSFRHPTTWHARDYGLVAANPFGLHDFLKTPLGTGAVTLAAGQSLTLRYRVYFIDGLAPAEIAEDWFEEFAASK